MPYKQWINPIFIGNEDEIKKHPFLPELPQRVFYKDGSVGDW